MTPTVELVSDTGESFSAAAPHGIVKVALALRDVELAMLLAVQLVRSGVSVELLRADLSELRTAHATADLVVVDIRLLEEAGTLPRVLRRTSPRERRAATIAIASRREDVDIARALAMGADDCVAPPVDPQAFVQRVLAVLQRAWRARAFKRPLSPIEQFGDVVIDVDARVVRRAGRHVPMQPKELDLLLALIARRGAAATRIELMTELGVKRIHPLSRVLDTLMSRLRSALENDPAHPRHLLTVARYGYRLEVGSMTGEGPSR